MARTKIPDVMLVNPSAGGAGAITYRGDNFAPNCQWQLWGQSLWVGKQNAAGTGDQPPISISGFDVSNNQPACFSSNTGEIKIGDIGLFGAGFQWGYRVNGYQPIGGAYLTANRVANVVPNSAIAVQGYFGGISPAASAATAFQAITPGDGGSSTNSASGWTKDSGLACWADDMTVNRCPGAIRVKGVRKTSGSTLTTRFAIQPKKLRHYAGRDVVFGVLVYHKVQGGAGTSRAFISEPGIGVTYSTSATGNSYVNPDSSYGKYEFLQVTRRVDANTTALEFGVSLDGNSSDVYYIAIPSAYFGTALTLYDLKQRPGEVIESIHWNPAMLTPFQLALPTTDIVVGAGGLYGWNNIDLEAISMGTVHKSISACKAKFEWKSSTVGAYAFAADQATLQHLRFGLQTVTQVANVNDTDSGEWPLYEDGTISLFGTVAGQTGHILTLDFWDVIA